VPPRIAIASGSQAILRVHGGTWSGSNVKPRKCDELKAMFYEITPENKIKSI
jgi:hypothetical protein